MKKAFLIALSIIALSGCDDSNVESLQCSATISNMVESFGNPKNVSVIDDMVTVVTTYWWFDQGTALVSTTTDTGCTATIGTFAPIDDNTGSYTTVDISDESVIVTVFYPDAENEMYVDGKLVNTGKNK